MVARVPGHLASLEEEGHIPASAGDRQGRPYGWWSYLRTRAAGTIAFAALTMSLFFGSAARSSTFE
jgi:predicted ArsR family transcriptional regulator